MSRLGFHLLHLFWWLASPSYRRLSRAHKIADVLAERRTRVVLSGGQQLTGVHPAALCEGHPCSIHHPSDHHMIDWAQNWRDDRNLMERVCRHHIGHPDPDHLAFIGRAAGPDRAAAEAIHGCDGCCHPAARYARFTRTDATRSSHDRIQPATYQDDPDADWVDVGGGLPWHDYGSTDTPGSHDADRSLSGTRSAHDPGSSDYSSDCAPNPSPSSQD